MVAFKETFRKIVRIEEEPTESAQERRSEHLNEIYRNQDSLKHLKNALTTQSTDFTRALVMNAWTVNEREYLKIRTKGNGIVTRRTLVVFGTMKKSLPEKDR